MPMTVLERRRLANPAREAKVEYLARLFIAGCDGDDTTHPVEAFEWYCTLIELCGPFAGHPDIAEWFEREERRLLKLI
jgi:hypothetical protein